MSSEGKTVSVFDNSEFCNGFMEFSDSVEYQKYMVPFLKELIEMHRTKLESTADFVKWQARLHAIRYVADMPEMLRFNKQDVAKGE